MSPTHTATAAKGHVLSLALLVWLVIMLLESFWIPAGTSECWFAPATVGLLQHWKDFRSKRSLVNSRIQIVSEEAVDGVDLVIHSAAMVHCGWRYYDEMYRVNVEGTTHLSKIARIAGVRFIHLSSVDALGLRSDGTPANEETPPGGMIECPYVLTKRMAESAVLDQVERGLDAVIVNPVYMIGPWDWKPSSGRMLLEVGSGKGLLAPPGANDFVDVRDVVSGIEAANERGQTGRRYILGGHALTYP